jgi:hypothetical protein
MLLEVNHLPVGLEVGCGVNIRFDLGGGKCYLLNMKITSIKSGEGDSVIECGCDGTMLSYSVPLLHDGLHHSEYPGLPGEISMNGLADSTVRVCTAKDDIRASILSSSIIGSEIAAARWGAPMTASPAPKRRGRPKGSKNKPKAPKEAPE